MPSNRDTRRVTVVFGSETGGAEQGFRRVGNSADELSGKTGKLNQLMEKLGPGILASIGAAGVAEAFRRVIGGASDLNETISKTNTIFKVSGPEIERWAGTTASSMGVSKRAALENASAFGNIFTQIGLTTGAAKNMSERWVQLASDFASFHNAKPEDVMAALQSATRGEYDALQKYVPTVNAAAIQTAALSASGKKSAAALTDAEKVTALYNLTLKNAGAANGDFARTSDSAANQQRILAAKLEDSAAKIGQVVLPAFQGLLGIINQVGPLNVALIGLGIAFGSKITAALSRATTGFRTYVTNLQETAATSGTTTVATTRLGRAIQTTGNVAVSSGKKFAGMARDMNLVSKVAAVIGISQIVTGGFAKELNPQIEILTNNLKEYADSGKLSGEASRLLGENLGHVRTMAWSVGDSFGDRASRGIGKFFEDIIGLSESSENSIAKSQERLKSFDEALKALVSDGKTDEAKAAFDRLAGALKAEGASMEDIKKAFPSYSAAIGAVGQQNATAAALIGNFEKQLTTLAPAFNGTATDAKTFQDALANIGKAGENTQSQMLEYVAILDGVGGSSLTTTDKTKVFNEALSGIDTSTASLADKGSALAGVFTKIGNAEITAKQKGDLLKSTMDQLYGAAMNQIEASESLTSSRDAFSESLRRNGMEFDINAGKTEAQRVKILANRDALQAALQATRNKYIADINAGVNADKARAAYQKSTSAVINQIDPTNRNKTAVKNLVKAYGEIPPTKTTKVAIEGDNKALDALVKSFALQRALSSNWSKAQADDYYTQLYRTYVTPNFIGPTVPRKLAGGGEVGGHSPHKRADNIPALLTAREYVQPVDSVDYYGTHVMEALRKRQIPADLMRAAVQGVIPDSYMAGYAKGGSVTGGNVWPMNVALDILNPVNLKALQKKFDDQVAGGVLGGQAGGAGYQWQINTLRKVFGNFGVYSTTGGGHAAGSYHYSGRAIDVQPIRKMAEYIFNTYGKTTKELISPWTELNIKNGAKFAYSRDTQIQHGATGKNAHIHWAYDQGGILPPGTTIAHNNTRKNEYVFTEDQLPGPHVVVNVTVQGNVTAEKDLARSIASEVRDELIRKGNRNGGKIGF